jgi:hypothetical protein
MKIATLCYMCAVVGMILTGLGRRLLIIEALSVSTGWAWAVRLLPLADIMFLARFWDSAKTGAIDTSAAYGRLDGDQKSAIFMDIKAEHEARLAAKRRRLDRLNVHLGAWYQSMQEKRASIATASPQEIEAFNAEAAAYTELREVTKKDDAEILALMSRKAKHLRRPKDGVDESDDAGEQVIDEI